MWKVSDEILKNLEDEIGKIYRRAYEISERIENRWKDIPKPSKCIACGVDGSRGIERLSGMVLYSVNSISVGMELREMSEITMLKPHVNIEERIRLHMHTSEFRLGSFAEEEIILVDGSLRGAFIRPAAYIEDPSRLLDSYEMENFITDFLEVLDKHVELLREDVQRDCAKKNYLLTREEIFSKMEKGYRKGRKRFEDLMIMAEYIEYLHALNLLLEKDVFFIAKSFYTHEFDEDVSDAAVLEVLALKQFGFEKAGYMVFKPVIRKTFPWFVREFNDNFRNLFREINSAFVRFEDYGKIYLVESVERIDEELISKLKSLEVEGYLLPLLQAHRIAKIKKNDLRKIMLSIFSSINPDFAPLIKRNREILEE